MKMESHNINEAEKLNCLFNQIKLLKIEINRLQQQVNSLQTEMYQIIKSHGKNQRINEPTGEIIELDDSDE